jgi:protein-tyrosine phosphatase
MKDVFWIKGNAAIHLAILLRPLGDDQMEAGLRSFKKKGAETVVSLLEEKEAIWLGLEDEGPHAERIGLRFLGYPIPDAHLPKDTDTFRAWIEELAGRLLAGEHIGIHCRGSIGRATVAAACGLIHLGWTPKAALAAIEEARGVPVPDTQEQQEWILRYKAVP